MIGLKGRSRILITLAGVALLWGTPVITSAQEQELAAAGKVTYEQNCAVCHGRDAKGDGPAMNLLTVKPTDLTQISERNNGTFPFWKIFRVIDGREEVRSHGTRDMPIWGAEFRAEPVGSSTMQSRINGKILELVFYLQSIQAQ